jgi:hypothetical protein
LVASQFDADVSEHFSEFLDRSVMTCEQGAERLP